MRYYLDTEFNGMGGELLSLALVREDGPHLYLIASLTKERPVDWVAENVLPVMGQSPHPRTLCPVDQMGDLIAGFLAGDPEPVIVTDWITDAKYFCEVMNVGSLWWTKAGGPMERIPSFRIEFAKVDAYPTTLPGAVQHNAYWDAMALRHKLESGTVDGETL